MKPDGASTRQPASNQREVNNVLRFHAHSDANVSSSIAMPRPTMIRNA